MADNLNTPYLGQLQGSDNINTPFLPETASEATVNVRSDTSIAGRLDVQGVTVLADTLAVTGVTTLSAALNSASAVSAGEGTFTGANFSSQITSTDAGGDFGSVATAANDTGMADGAFRFVNAASGVSMAYRSGGTTYYLGGSTISEA